MAVIPDFKRETLLAFLRQNVTPGSTVYTDGLKSFTGLPEAGFQHEPRSQPLPIDLRKGAKSVVPLADRAIGNLQQWLIAVSAAISSRFISTNSSSATIVGGYPWPRSKPCSASGPRINLRPMNKSAVQPISLSHPRKGDRNL